MLQNIFSILVLLLGTRLGIVITGFMKLYTFINTINVLSKYLSFYFFNLAEDSYSIMWRKADGEPNHYLVVGNMIMDKTQDHRMRVEITNDEDIKTNGSFYYSFYFIFLKCIMEGTK